MTWMCNCDDPSHILWFKPRNNQICEKCGYYCVWKEKKVVKKDSKVKVNYNDLLELENYFEGEEAG